MRPDVVLQDEATQRTGRLVLRLELRQHIDQVVVKVRVLVQFFQFLRGGGQEREREISVF